MTSLTCANAGDANAVRAYINNYASHPNQLFYKGKQVVSTFAGEGCTFGQSSFNAAWTYAVKTGVSSQVAFIPSFFSDPSTFASNTFQDGDFNWNGGWPLTDSDVSFTQDQQHISANSGRYFMAAVSPLFFTHYGPNSYNKIYIMSRPHPKTATASSDSVSIPNDWQWTDDNIYCVVFSTGTYTLTLTVGSSTGTFAITPGVNEVKLAMAPGTPTAKLTDSGGNTVLSFNSGFNIVSNPTTYNFNYYIASSP